MMRICTRVMCDPIHTYMHLYPHTYIHITHYISLPSWIRTHTYCVYLWLPVVRQLSSPVILK
jgi:hypothetical protein